MNTQIIANLQAVGPMPHSEFIKLLTNKLQENHTIAELETLYGALPSRKTWGDAEMNVAVSISGARKNILRKKLEGQNCSALAGELRHCVGPDGFIESSWHAVENGLNISLIADTEDVIRRVLENRFSMPEHGRPGFCFYDAWGNVRGRNYEPAEDNDDFTRFMIAETKRLCAFNAEVKTCSHM